MSTNQFAAEPELVDPTIAELTAEPVVEEELETTEDQDESESDTELEEVDDSDEALEKEFEQVESAKTALESYVQILKQVGPEGISHQTTSILNLGLKHLENTLGRNLKNITLENYDHKNLMITGVISTESSFKDILKKSLDLIISLFKVIIRSIDNIFDNYKLGIYKLSTKASNTYRKAKDMEFVKGVKVTLTQADKISADGEVLLNDISLISDLAEFVSTTFPLQASSVYGAMSKAFRSIDVVQDNVQEKVLDILSMIHELPTKDIMADNVIFPGNFRLIADGPVSFKMVKDDSLKSVSEHTYEIKHNTSIDNRALHIASDAKLLKTTINRAKTLTDYVNDLQREIEAFIKRLSGSNDEELIKNAIGPITKIMNDARPSVDNVLSYLIKTLNTYWTITEHEISLMEAALKKV